MFGAVGAFFVFGETGVEDFLKNWGKQSEGYGFVEEGDIGINGHTETQIGRHSDKQIAVSWRLVRRQPNKSEWTSGHTDFQKDMSFWTSG